VTMEWTGRIIAGTLAALLIGCAGTPDKAAEADRGGTARDSGGATAAPAPAAAPTIVFLGTSLTAGLGLDPDAAYPALIQRKVDSAGLRYSVINAGVSGESSAGALRRIDWILRQPPAFLVIETGANDGLRGQDPDSIRANVQGMIDRVRKVSPSTRIILAGMEALPNLGADYTRRFRAVYPALATSNRLPLIPFLLDRVAGVDSLNQQDGMHPTEAGAKIVADNVWRVLRPELK
jgi:acyl-CoA thioesterase I